MRLLILLDIASLPTEERSNRYVKIFITQYTSFSLSVSKIYLFLFQRRKFNEKEKCEETASIFSLTPPVAAMAGVWPIWIQVLGVSSMPTTWVQNPGTWAVCNCLPRPPAGSESEMKQPGLQPGPLWAGGQSACCAMAPAPESLISTEEFSAPKLFNAIWGVDIWEIFQILFHFFVHYPNFLLLLFKLKTYFIKMNCG